MEASEIFHEFVINDFNVPNMIRVIIEKYEDVGITMEYLD
jgi:hypothetical protein